MDQQSRVRCKRHEAASAVDQVELILGELNYLMMPLLQTRRSKSPGGRAYLRSSPRIRRGVKEEKELAIGYLRGAFIDLATFFLQREGPNAMRGKRVNRISNLI